jgi:hypothetical protein
MESTRENEVGSILVLGIVHCSPFFIILRDNVLTSEDDDVNNDDLIDRHTEQVLNHFL